MNLRFLFSGRASIPLLAVTLVVALGAILVFWSAGEESRPPAPAAKPSAPVAAVPTPPTHPTADWKARAAKSAVDNFPDLLREVLAQPASHARDAALAALLSDWITRGPQGLRAFLDTLGLAEDNDLAAAFFSALPGALPLIDGRAATSPYLRELVSQLVRQDAENDPHRALEWANAWLLDESLDEARATISGVLAEESPDEALRLLDKIGNPLRRIEALSAIGEGYARNDAPAAMKWAETLPHDTEMMIAMNGVLTVMAENDPAAAAAAFQVMQGGVQERYHALVVKDRQARGLPAEPRLDEQGNEIVRDAGGEDAMPSENPDFNLLSAASATIASGIAASDPAAALRWADSLPGILKTDGKRAALGAWAESQPAQAFQFCQTNGWVDAETYGNVFSSWADSDPTAASAAIAQVEVPRVRQAAIASVAESWAGNGDDLGPVTQWIQQLPRVADRDAANRAIAESIDADQPQGAWDHALSISNSDARRAVLTSAFANLVATKPSGAAAALSRASNLTAKERSDLSGMLAGRDLSR